MLVDPNTGMPIGDPTPSANTIGGQVGMDAIGSAGYSNQDLPLAYDMLSSLPSATATMGWNVSRVQNTILGGGRMGAQSARGVRQTASPAAWRRLARGANIDPSIRNAGVEGKGIYSPFNFLSWIGNKTHELALGNPKIGSSVATHMGTAAPFSPGTIGRLGTANKIGSLSNQAIKSRASNIINAIEDIDPQSRIRTVFDNRLAIGQSTAQMSGSLEGGLLNTITGKYSGRAAGFIRGAELYGTEGQQALKFGAFRAETRNPFVREGVDAAAKFMAERGGSVAGRLLASGAVSGAARAAGPIGWMLLAKDFAMMGGKLVGASMRLGIDAGKSLQGSINKPAFGMGFKDNTIASTSRQRGVMAIQNSRLNMRSALGSEASFVHARFG